MSRATQINQAIARAVYGQEAISRTVKFTFENLEATESALFELFTMCEEFGTPVEVRKVAADTWEFSCLTGEPIITPEGLRAESEFFPFEGPPSEALRSFIRLRALMQACIDRHPRDEETDTPRLLSAQSRQSIEGGPLREGIEMTCIWKET